MRRRVILIGTIVGIAAVAILAIWFFLPVHLFVPTAAAENCSKCHGDMDRLTELSEQPEKYYVDPAQFSQEAHGGLACTTCHAGDPTKDTPKEACLEGHAYQNPAATAVVSKTCGTCHPEITGRHLSSIHVSLDGIRLSLVDLLGEKDGSFKFEATCNDCHTTCSSCHMEEPDRRNMLWPRTETHHFESKSNSKACAACHAGMGDTFFGTTTPKHEPSLMARAGMQCTDCHGDKDVHGTGVKTQFSMQSPKPTCEECHKQPTPRVTSAKDTRVAPQYSPDTAAHAMHPETSVSCIACHTEWYPSCWNCHDGRTDKTVESLYLAVSPLTHTVQPAAHSPAVSGATGPIPTAMGGGWAIKARHSWGASHTCEDCHAKPEVYISSPDRQAPFVGYWTAKRANASFVDEKLVATLIIDTEKAKQSAHKDQKCEDCHESLADDVCTDCHNKTPKTGKTFLPAEGDWSRMSYLNVQTHLDQSAELIRQAREAGVDTNGWQAQWNTLHDSYLQASNEFHAKPGEVLSKVNTVATNSQALLQTMQQAAQARRFQNQLFPAGAMFGIGTIGALILGLVMHKRLKR